MKYRLILLLVIAGIGISNAQLLVMDDKPKNDSTTIYHSIYEYSKQSSLNKFLYDLIFRKPLSDGSKKAAEESPFFESYKGSEGKIIRNIIIFNEDPLTVNENDTSTSKSQKRLNKVGNFFHTNTRPFIIRNLLLFKENQKFDSLVIQESERLVRSQRYIEESIIRGLNIEETSDSIDVIVVIKDKLSIYPEGQITSSRFGIGLKDINLLGMGHQAHVNYSWNYKGGVYDYQYDYNIPNLLNTYINAGILYKWNEVERNETRQISAERPFYSPLARWAGGVTLLQQSKKYDINIPKTDDFILQKFKYNIVDVWGAYAFNLKNKNTIKARTQKLVISARYYHIDYLISPDEEYDPLNIYSAENLYLFGIGISKRNYKKDSHIFRFGFTEDIPVGYNFNITTGIQHKNNNDRFYMAAKLSMGDYCKPGYLSGSLEFGSFLEGIDIKEGVFTAELNYFTPLIKIGDWKLRQFIKPQYMIGINRLKSDRLSLEDYFGINNFNSRNITGTQKFVCNFQTQTFTPWNLWGFKLAPYFIYSMGILGNQKQGFKNSKIYSLFGLGFLIRNDNLVFNSFEMSISFYPYIPENGNNIFKFNAYEASDFKLRDYDFKKPDQVIYK